MYRKKLALNTISSLTFQIVTIICGLILPRLILQGYGSDNNGLVNSIMQFLQVIAFLELGVGSVIQSALYRPLVRKDSGAISRIVTSGDKFFRRLAEILLIYIAILIVVYPEVVSGTFEWLYTVTLIISISISFFAEYYFGIVNRLLLTADQHGYIQYTAQIVTLIANTLACVVLIELGTSLQLVKLTTSLIYLVRPIFLSFYVKKHYALNRRAQYSDEPIKQKWNGVAQHIAAIVLDGTDTIVLTLFSTLANVSVYSIYYLVTNGVTQLMMSTVNGVQALCGELLAKRDYKQLEKVFGYFDWVVHTGTVFVFGCTEMLIVPFVRVYTRGISDTNYMQPLFALLMVAASAGHCLRLPYNVMILAGGHYKQTQSNYIVAAILNIVISIIGVKFWGLVGVALGSLVAMGYQTVWMAFYNSQNFIHWPMRSFWKQVFIDFLTLIVGVFLTWNFSLGAVNYLGWFVLALKVAVVWLLVVSVVNVIFYNYRIKSFIHKIKR